MNPDVYAKAIFELEVSGSDAGKIVGGTVGALKRRGAISLLPKILKAYKRLIERARSTGSVLTIARASDKAGALMESRASEGTAIKVDSDIIGGYRLESGSSLVDNSFKRHLLQIYRNVTSA